MSSEARSLVALYDQRLTLTHEMAVHPRPTGAMAQAVLDKGAELDAACETYRRKHHPRKHRLFVATHQVWTTSKTGRNAALVFDGAS